MSYEWLQRETFAPPEWAPPPPAPPRRSRLRWLVAALSAVVLLGGGGLGWLAWHNDRNAQRWRNLDLAEARRAGQLTEQVKTANTRIGLLSSQLTTLTGQISSLQGQLSSVANQKEKALDQTSVLQQLVDAAGRVANDLQKCIIATSTFDGDFNAALAAGNPSQIASLQKEASRVTQTCNQAETANQALQSAIQQAP